MPDGISSQDYFRANLPQVEALKKKQLFDAMKSSAPQPNVNTTNAQPRINIGSNGSLVGVQPTQQPSQSPSPSIDLPTPNMQGVVTTEPQPVRMGVDISGLKGSQRGLAQLGAMQDANEQGLNTKTSGDFVETQAPRPKHLGIGEHIKSALKDAVINAGEYARTHPGAGAAELLGAGGAGAAIGAASPDTGDILNRRYQIQQQEGDVSRDLSLDKERAQIGQLGQVPVTLANGTTVYTDRKHAADLINKQQDVNLRNRQETNRESNAQAHKARWDAMDKHQAAQEAQAIYNSGAADNDPEMLAEVGKRMGLTKPPPAHTAGDIRLDEKGNYILINKRSGQVSDTGQESYAPTQEANKETRANIIANGTDTRANRKRQSEAANLAGQVKAAQGAIVDLQNKIQADPTHEMYYKGEIAKQQAILTKAQTGLGAYGDVYDEKGPRQLTPNPQNTPSAKMGRGGQIQRAPTPTTHNFSIAAYQQRNQGATEDDARAYAKQNYPDYKVVP